MKKLLFLLPILVLSCSLVYRTESEKLLSTETPNATVTMVETILLPTRTQTDTKKPTKTRTLDAIKDEKIGVSPFCTILGNEDTRTIEYGYEITFNWGWGAKTEQQVFDYIENVIFQITFDGEEIRDAERGDVYESEGEYHVFWWKELGILDRGEYKMMFYSEFKEKIFDGWDYYGPGTDNETIQDTCYLVIE